MTFSALYYFSLQTAPFHSFDGIEDPLQRGGFGKFDGHMPARMRALDFGYLTIADAIDRLFLTQRDRTLSPEEKRIARESIQAEVMELRNVVQQFDDQGTPNEFVALCELIEETCIVAPSEGDSAEYAQEMTAQLDECVRVATAELLHEQSPYLSFALGFKVKERLAEFVPTRPFNPSRFDLREINESPGTFASVVRCITDRLTSDFHGAGIPLSVGSANTNGIGAWEAVRHSLSDSVDALTWKRDDSRARTELLDWMDALRQVEDRLTHSEGTGPQHATWIDDEQAVSADQLLADKTALLLAAAEREPLGHVDLTRRFVGRLLEADADGRERLAIAMAIPPTHIARRIDDSMTGAALEARVAEVAAMAIVRAPVESRAVILGEVGVDQRPLRAVEGRLPDDHRLAGYRPLATDGRSMTPDALRAAITAFNDKADRPETLPQRVQDMGAELQGTVVDVIVPKFLQPIYDRVARWRDGTASQAPAVAPTPDAEQRALPRPSDPMVSAHMRSVLDTAVWYVWQDLAPRSESDSHNLFGNRESPRPEFVVRSGVGSGYVVEPSTNPRLYPPTVVVGPELVASSDTPERADLGRAGETPLDDVLRDAIPTVCKFRYDRDREPIRYRVGRTRHYGDEVDYLPLAASRDTSASAADDTQGAGRSSTSIPPIGEIGGIGGRSPIGRSPRDGRPPHGSFSNPGIGPVRDFSNPGVGYTAPHVERKDDLPSQSRVDDHEPPTDGPSAMGRTAGTDDRRVERVRRRSALPDVRGAERPDGDERTAEVRRTAGPEAEVPGAPESVSGVDIWNPARVEDTPRLGLTSGSAEPPSGPAEPLDFGRFRVDPGTSPDRALDRTDRDDPGGYLR